MAARCAVVVAGLVLLLGVAHAAELLFVGGGFTVPETDTAHLAVFNTQRQWDPVRSQVGSPTERVWSQATYVRPAENASVTATSFLLVGGMFERIGGVDAAHVARWDGVTWAGVGGGTDGAVCIVMTTAGGFYVGGSFQHAGGGAVPAASVARWTDSGEGGFWQALGAGIGGDGSTTMVYALAEYDGTLLAGGEYTWAGTGPAASIAAWDGTVWRQVGQGASGRVFALSFFGGRVWAAGDFVLNGVSPTVRYLATLSGSGWTNASVAFDKSVAALYKARDGRTLYAAGQFTGWTGCDPTVSNCAGIVAIDTAGRISAVTAASGGGEMGIDTRVEAVTEYNGQLVVAGRFFFASSGGGDEGPANVENLAILQPSRAWAGVNKRLIGTALSLGAYDPDKGAGNAGTGTEEVGTAAFTTWMVVAIAAAAATVLVGVTIWAYVTQTRRVAQRARKLQVHTAASSGEDSLRAPLHPSSEPSPYYASAAHMGAADDEYDHDNDDGSQTSGVETPLPFDPTVYAVAPRAFGSPAAGFHAPLLGGGVASDASSA
jgi:hypothetical protein